MRLDPQSDPARALLGRVYFTIRKTGLAIQELEAALKIKPDNRVAIYQLMLAYQAAGRDADAARMQDKLRAAMEKERQEDLQRSRIRLLKKPDER